jgi:predicted transcriptional regulator
MAYAIGLPFVSAGMIKNITFRLDDELIRRVRDKASREGTSFNALFRQWLRDFTEPEAAVSEYRALMQRLNHVRAGQKFTRDEMNERR